VITLQATDSDESSGQATRTIEILEGTADEPLDLSVMPASLGVARFARQGPATYPFSLRSSGEQVLEWNAGEDAAWLRLDATSGSTPSDIQLTVDPTGLEPGTYRGALTVRSVDARNSPVTVPVVLQVEELCTIYLPVVQRQ
jgi:hypothetical protein